MEIASKTCKLCGQTKTIDIFCARSYLCKACDAQRAKDRRRSPEYIAATKTLEFRAAQRERYGKWLATPGSRAKLIEKWRKQQKPLRPIALLSAEQAERRRISNRARWLRRKGDPAFVVMRREISKSAKAKRRTASGSFAPRDIREILRLQRSKCAMCAVNVADGYHVDHIVPLARDGTNDRRNIQILCPTCNRRKSAKDPMDFARSIGLLL